MSGDIGNPNLHQALSAFFDNVLSRIHTAMPARIEKYDYSTQKAEVKPYISRKYPDNTVLELPVIVNVPVVFLRSGGASLNFPVSQGDNCLLICCERSIDKWLSAGDVSDPTDLRRFDLSDAVAILGLNPFSVASEAPNNDDVQLKYNNT